jgi:putative DNA primase/helicase
MLEHCYAITGRAAITLLPELLGDFTFKDPASRAHAFAAIVLPFVRQMIDGPTPLHLLDAPVEGTGKTLLASAISLISTGRDAQTIPDAGNEEEWRKRITAILLDAPTFILLDNLNRTPDSSALAAALTTRSWKDRLLGYSKTVNLPNRAVRRRLVQRRQYVRCCRLWR